MGLVIAEISYTNILPLFYSIDRDRLIKDGCKFIPKIPSKLNEAMANGTVDVGGISSFAYGEHIEEYVLLPNLSVSSPKEVGSIFLFSKVPITELNGKSIGLTSSSSTSVNLLRILLKKYYDLDPLYETMDPDYKTMMEKHDACLLIGDDAILTLWHANENIHRYDLGELWEHFTGYPMTFAVVAVRKDAWEKEPELLEILFEEFQSSKQAVIENQFEEMIKDIREKMGGSKSFWDNYFSGLNYDLTVRHIEGLHLYYDLAYELGLLHNKVKNISLWQPAGYCQSV